MNERNSRTVPTFQKRRIIMGLFGTIKPINLEGVDVK